MLSQNEDLAIGIDLGTTFSCVGVYHKGAVKIISNEDGNRITPSCVSFTDEGVLKGERAKQRLSMAPKNTVYEVKRLMGRSFDDPGVQADMKTWPFKVVDDGGKPSIQVKQKDVTKNFAAEEISAMILSDMKQLAEKYLEMPVSKAVITVPAYFDANQRYATENAARIAGLEVLRIINEPTAAALAYYDEGEFPSGKNVLIFDLGGGTYDVSILRFEPGILEVVSTKGDTHLGGTDFDNQMVTKCRDWYNASAGHQHIPDDPNSLTIIRLRTECERVKCILSKKVNGQMRIDHFGNVNDDFEFKFTRAEFERLNMSYFTKAIKIVEEALTDANLRKDEIDDIVLVGGSSRIPKLQSLLKTFFNNKPINKSINPDEAVAHGAALQAALLNGDQGQNIKELLLLDVTPLSLGVDIKGDLMSTIVTRNSLIPASRTRNYTTIHDFQTSIKFDIFQGERSSTLHNQKIGSVTINDIASAPAGVASVDTTIEINTNGTIFVVVTDKATKNEEHIAITNDKTRASKDDIKRMIEDAKSHKQEDALESARVKARNELDTFANWMQFITREFKDSLTLRDETSNVKSTIQWIQNNPDKTTEQYHVQKSELERAVSNLPAEYRIPGTLPPDHAHKYERPTSHTRRQTRATSAAHDLD